MRRPCMLLPRYLSKRRVKRSVDRPPRQERIEGVSIGSAVASVPHVRETLRCRDPLGREIVLMDDRWYGKVLVDRPELQSALDVVERTITDPDSICDDKFFDDREVFYRRDLLPSPHGWKLVKVVV